MAETLTVRVIHGRLRGQKVKTQTGTPYYSFHAIPYAKPPVGPLRFKAPVSVEPWTGVLDALKPSNAAPQVSILSYGKYAGNEDCLYLNVFTPKLPAGDTSYLKPVLVYIHGGAFYLGSGGSQMHGPGRFMNTGEVVLVTMNYRLGALGFLCTGDSEVPGNNGLKDQVMALRWVQQNIAQFGGDPGNVTIGGSGAGAISVQLHILSPMSRGLFHRAIISSDSAIRPVYGEDASTARCKAFRLGEALGCKTSESKKLIEFLMKVPAYEFVDIIDRTLNEEEKHPVPVFFLPVVEKGMQTEEVFLSERPIDIIKQGTFTQVPIITGVTSREGLFIMADFVANPSWYCSLSDNFESMLMSYFRLKKGNENTQEIARKVKKFYFGYQRISCETLPQLVDFYGDIFCNLWTYRNARELQANSEYPVYFYTFSYVGNFGDSPGLFTFEQVKGASHGSDLAYLFETFFHKDHYDHPQHESMKMCSKMLKMWINFAKTGNPTPEEDPLLGVTWKPITEKEFNYLNIDKKLSLQKDLLKERMDFWEEIMS